MSLYGAVPGVRLEDLGESFATFSPASGQTHLINDESCALLDWLQSNGPGSSADAARALADEAGLPATELLPSIEAGWSPLVAAGLVRRIDNGGYPPLP